MSDSGSTDREAVRAFFEYRLNVDELRPQPVAYKLALGLAVLGAAIGYGSLELYAAYFMFLVGLLLVLGIDYLRIQRDIERRRTAQEDNHAEFSRLAEAAREAQARDVCVELKRAFARTHLERSRLCTFDRRYMFDHERALFPKETLAAEIGDLIDRSIRMISMGQPFSSEITPLTRRIRAPNGLPGALHFNPMRLVALFVTSAQLVICDVQIDSIGDNRTEEIQRISRSKIVNVIFKSARKRQPANEEALQKLIEQLGYTVSEADQVFGPPDRRKDWVEEHVTSELSITRSDGGTLIVPIRSEIQWVQSASGRAQDGALSADEVEIDHMIHALNRLLEQAPTAVA